MLHKRGDLIAAGKAGDVDYLVQQGNCLTCRPHGLSQAVADAWPAYGDIYAGRTAVEGCINVAVELCRPAPGDFELYAPHDAGKPVIVALFAQWRPGKITIDRAVYGSIFPGLPTGERETAAARFSWFKTALAKFEQHLCKDIAAPAHTMNIGFPSKIGCGLAGGHWPDYLSALEAFAKRLDPMQYRATLYEQ